MSHDEWLNGTKTIREWLRGGGVNPDVLAAELRFWADYMDSRHDEPAKK